MSQSDSVVVCVKFSKGRFGKSWKKESGKGGGESREDSLLERVTAAAEERQLSQNSLRAYLAPGWKNVCVVAKRKRPPKVAT
jgi:hypothetical protein